MLWVSIAWRGFQFQTRYVICTASRAVPRVVQQLYPMFLCGRPQAVQIAESAIQCVGWKCTSTSIFRAARAGEQNNSDMSGWRLVRYPRCPSRTSTHTRTHQLQSGNGCCCCSPHLVSGASLYLSPFSPHIVGVARNDGCQLLLSLSCSSPFFILWPCHLPLFPALGSLLQPFHQPLEVMIFKHDMLQPSSVEPLSFVSSSGDSTLMWSCQLFSLEILFVHFKKATFHSAIMTIIFYKKYIFLLFHTFGTRIIASFNTVEKITLSLFFYVLSKNFIEMVEHL